MNGFGLDMRRCGIVILERGCARSAREQVESTSSPRIQKRCRWRHMKQLELRRMRRKGLQETKRRTIGFVSVEVQRLSRRRGLPEFVDRGGQGMEWAVARL